MSMNVFEECPIKDREVIITSGSMAGETFEVEDWARNVMAKGVEWPSDMGNPAVLLFLVNRRDLIERMRVNQVEFLRVALSALYGHVGMSGCIVMPEELGIEVE